MSFTPITMTGTVRLADGTPASQAEVTFTLSAPISDGSDLVAATPVVATCDAQGAFSVVLNANDDPTTMPRGTSYGVLIQQDGRTLDRFSVVVPHDATGATVDLFTLAPVSTSPPAVQYVAGVQAGEGIAVTPAAGGAVEVSSPELIGHEAATKSVHGIEDTAGLARLVDVPGVPPPLVQVTGPYTLQLTDAGATVEVDSATATQVLIPPHSDVPFPVNTLIEVDQAGDGAVTIAAGDPAVLIESPNGTTTTNARYSSATLRQRAIDEWVVEAGVAAPPSVPRSARIYTPPRYYFNPGRVDNTGSGTTYGDGDCLGMPFIVESRQRFDRIQHRLFSTGSAGGKLRLGLYADNNEDPGNLIVDAGQGGAASGDPPVELAIDVTLDPGLYWIAVVMQNIAALATKPQLLATRGYPGDCPGVWNRRPTDIGYVFPKMTGVTGALPAVWASNDQAAFTVRVAMRAAA